MKQLKILLASILGNTLEYYEFSIFAVFAIQIGQAFFPNQDSVNQIFLTLILFGIGFLSRPIGSAIFGHIGDKVGRKKALDITIIGMSISTFGIGFMPSFNQIGMVAPISLLLLRLFQGLFIGGEGAGSAVYILENKLKINRNVVGGLLFTSNISGVIIASIVGLAINKTVGLDQDSWRYAFIGGGVAGLIISYMRITIPESDEFHKLDKKDKHPLPIIKLFTTYWKQGLVVISFAGFTSGVSYTVKGYLSVHLQKFMNLPTNESFLLLMYTTVIFAVLPPFWGMLSNKYTYRTFIRATSIFIIIMYVPTFMLISKHNYFALITGLTLLGLMASAICTPIYIYFSDLFPTAIRYSGVAVSFNIGISLIGGFTPAASTYLVDSTQVPYAPAFYIISLGIAYLLFESFMHKRIEYFGKK